MSDDLYREIEKRERLVQTFLIIGGFLLTITDDPIRKSLGMFFSIFLLTIVLYYIFISRTKMSNLVNYLALVSSLMYSFIIVSFFNVFTKYSDFNFIIFFIILTIIFTYSLLSPNTSDKISNTLENFFEKQEKNHPKIVNGILRTTFIILIVFLLYRILSKQ